MWVVVGSCLLVFINLYWSLQVIINVVLKLRCKLRKARMLRKVEFGLRCIHECGRSVRNQSYSIDAVPPNEGLMNLVFSTVAQF